MRGTNHLRKRCGAVQMQKCAGKVLLTVITVIAVILSLGPFVPWTCTASGDESYVDNPDGIAINTRIRLMPYIKQVEITRIDCEDGGRSTLVKVILNSLTSSVEGLINHIEFRDSNGDVYQFNPEEFHSTDSCDFFLKELPFLLPDGDIVVTLYNNEGVQDEFPTQQSRQRTAQSPTCDGEFSGETNQGLPASLSASGTSGRFSVTMMIYGIYCSAKVTVTTTVYISNCSFSSSGSNHVFSGTYISASDTWEGSYYYYDTYCMGSASGPWEASREAPEPNISISPTSFGALDVIASIDSPGSDPRALEFDGTYLWNGDAGTDKIYQLDTAGNIIDSFDSPGSYPNGLAFDGTYLWNADSGTDKIYQLDTAGNIIDSFDSPGSSPIGLAFDGTYLWNADSIADKIYQLDTAGNIIDSFDSPGSYPTGLAFDGTYLWNADATADKIYQLDTAGNIIDSFDSPGSMPRGLAFDGTYLWNADATADKIYQLEMPCPVYVGSSISQTFTVTNSGTGDLVIGTLLITGTDASEFSIQNDNCSGQTIASLGTCTFDVVFSPTSGGKKSAILEIPSNDPDTPTLNVPLRGTALISPFDIILTPDSTTVPRGGTLGFQATVTNNADKPGIIHFATKVTLPNGNPYPPSGYLFGPKKVSIDPYQSKSGHLSHTIPMGAPLGPYIYHGYIGRPGMGIIDEDQFDFEVVEAPPVIAPEDWETIVDQEFTE